MFFICGITNGKDDLSYDGDLFVHSCGAYGRYQVFMTYFKLSLFFIPILKFNKKYFVRTTCCDKIYGLDKSLGQKIENSIDVIILEDDLIEIEYEQNSNFKICKNCKYKTHKEFLYCPKCGQKF